MMALTSRAGQTVNFSGHATLSKDPLLRTKALAAYTPYFTPPESS